MIENKKEFILFDTEYTAWEGSMQRNWSGENEYRELVKISAIKVKRSKEEKLEIEDKVDIFVKPTINPILSEYFTKLTGIEMRDVEEYGVDLEEAIEILYEFSLNENQEYIDLYSYGNDFGIIEENVELKNLNLKFIKDWKKKFHNIREYFEKNGVDTSKYTSGSLYKHYSIDIGKENIHDSSFDTYSLFVSLKAAEELKNCKKKL